MRANSVERPESVLAVPSHTAIVDSNVPVERMSKMIQNVKDGKEPRICVENLRPWNYGRVNSDLILEHLDRGPLDSRPVMHASVLSFRRLGPETQAPQALGLRVVKTRQEDVKSLITTRRLGSRK